MVEHWNTTAVLPLSPSEFRASTFAGICSVLAKGISKYTSSTPSKWTMSSSSKTQTAYQLKSWQIFPTASVEEGCCSKSSSAWATVMLSTWEISITFSRPSTVLIK